MRFAGLTLAALLLAAGGQEKKEVREQGRGADPEHITQAIAPDQVFVGSFSKPGETEWFAVDCEKEAIYNLQLKLPEAQKGYFAVRLKDRGVFKTDTFPKLAQILRFRLPKGRTPIRVECAEWAHGGEWRFELTPVTDLSEGREVKPNREAKEATPMRVGEKMWGQASGIRDDFAHFRIEIPEDGAYHFVIRRLRPDPQRRLEGQLEVAPEQGDRPGDRLYRYAISEADDEFHFYPVLEAKPHYLVFHPDNSSPVGDGYELLIEPAVLAVDDKDLENAKAAIDRGVAWLLTPPSARARDAEVVAAESMALAALSEGKGAKERRESLDRDYVAWFEQTCRKAEGTWEGHEVFEQHSNMYAQAMAALGLAEAAANGSERAKALCKRAAEYLLATQISKSRCKAWKGPFPEDQSQYGGWRYGPDADSSDLSVQGWCLIALTAVDAAGIEAPGLREALTSGVKALKMFRKKVGFTYVLSRETSSNILNSIGVLIQRLYGIQAAPLQAAERDLDRHYCAATQVDDGDKFVFYYAYYATRANYLRSGRAWERWRAATIRQLVRRQTKEGFWTALDRERDAGNRWTTALGVMILRLCLNEGPKYLKLEARGF